MAEGKNDEESSLSPTIASSSPNVGAGNNPNNDVQAARRGLLKAIFQTSIAPRFSSIPIDLQTNNANFSACAFSSKPIDMDGYFSSDRPNSGGSFVRENSCVTIGTNKGDGDTGSKQHTDEETRVFQNSIYQESSCLTPSERGYLQGLLQSDDLDSIRRASVRLSDKELFPTTTDSDDDVGSEVKNEGSSAIEDGDGLNNKEASATTKSNNTQLPPTQQRRRDSQVQEQLLEWHEKTTIMPSVVLRRMSSNQSARKTPPLPVSSRRISQNNSLTQDDNYEADTIGTEEKEYEDERSLEENEQRKQLHHEDIENVQQEDETWNSDLLDLNSWIARTEGVEVDEEGNPTTPTNITSNTFKILGTLANDVSCQPMVLSPPLMEGLQLFMPESLQEYHYWLKYSLVRDGPGLMKMLRQCRGSQHTILAIETTDGHVFGSFTSQPWRLMSSPGKGGTNHYYGSKESFVWRMRQSRFEPCESVVEQILMESKMDVFPFTSQNNKVQSCTTTGIALGYGEVLIEEERMTEVKQNDIDVTKKSVANSTNHYEHAIKLDKSMTSGSTSSSETFGSPCLIERESRGKFFEVANVELWSLTPHDTVEEADQAEMKILFLEEENRHNDNSLNLIEILVGTPGTPNR
jgi:hypothetical protein